MVNESIIASKNSYENALIELGREHDNIIVLDSNLSKNNKTNVFRQLYPEHYIDFSTLDSNMVGVAAGFATMGEVPFINSFSMFTVGYSFEKIRNFMGHQKLNIKIGVTVPECGCNKECNEDIAFMRTVPGMVIINPCDDTEARAAVFAAYEYDGPVYLRFNKSQTTVINNIENYKFKLGKGVVLKEGSDLTIVATGSCVADSLSVANQLAEEGINAKVINIHTIKPLDEELIIEAAKKTGTVVTVEKHSVIGGLGSAVCDTLSFNCPTKVLKIGIQDDYNDSKQVIRLHTHEVNTNIIYNKIKSFI